MVLYLYYDILLKTIDMGINTRIAAPFRFATLIDISYCSYALIQRGYAFVCTLGNVQLSSILLP